MSSVIQVLRSSTAGARPTGRAPGELFWNDTDGIFGIVKLDGSTMNLAPDKTIFNHVGEVLADTILKAADVTPNTTIIRTRQEGFSWLVVNANEHITTAGGIKLRALPDGSGTYYAEQFGCDGRNTTVCTAEFQAFVNHVVANRARGVAAGFYRVDDTIWVNGQFVDGATNTNNAGDFTLSIGSGNNNQSGLHYFGPSGTGPEPNNCKPVINFHNCNGYKIENLFIKNQTGDEKAFTTGAQWTSSLGNQRGNAMIDDIRIQGFERGIVVGLASFFAQQFDLFEKVNVQRCVIVETRHPVYLDCKTSDGWTFSHLQMTTYNTATGPKFHLDSPATTMAEKLFEIANSGIGWINSCEIAQFDMASGGICFDVQSDFNIRNVSVEVTDALILKQNIPSTPRNPITLSNIRTHPNAFTTANGVSVDLIGPARVRDSAFPGKIKFNNPIFCSGVVFHHVGDPTNLSEQAIRDICFVPNTAATMNKSILLDIQFLDVTAQPGTYVYDFSYNYVPGPVVHASNAAPNGQTTAFPLLENDNKISRIYAYNLVRAGAIIGAGEIRISRWAATVGSAAVLEFGADPQVILAVDDTDIRNGNVTLNVTNNYTNNVSVELTELNRGYRP